MKTYQTVPIKRQIQNHLFSNLGITGTAASGLAGTNPYEYIDILNRNFNCSEIFLYDTNPIQCTRHINKKDIVDAHVTNIMDCDFCATVATDGQKLIDIFNKMNDLPGKKVLSFTFSLRLKGGLQRTLDYLNQNLFDNSLYFVKDYQKITKSKPFWSYGYSHSASSKFDETRITTYRDTSHMMSGVISWS